MNESRVPWLLALLACVGVVFCDYGYLLPGNVYPLNYNLCLDTSINDCDSYFGGAVEIEVVCKEATSVITLHAKELHITSVAVISADYRALTLDSYSQGCHDFLHILVGETLVVDSHYRVCIEFYGNLSSTGDGYYYGAYQKTQTQELSWWASTDFSLGARRAFPCFDEIDIKATFIISLGYEEHLVAITNTPLLTIEPHSSRSGWVQATFDKSDYISPDMISFTIIEYTFKETYTADGLFAVKVWTHKDQINQVTLVLETASKCVDYLKNYLQIDSPWPKLDIVALGWLKNTFESNWGMVTAYEKYFFWSNDFGSLSAKRDIVVAEAKSIAYSYFGQLVTPKSRSEIWLQDAFSAFFASLCINHVYPEMNEAFFMFGNCERYREVDARANAPRLIQSLDAEGLLSTQDDTTSTKGYLIVRFLYNFLGEEVFLSGLTTYLKTYAHGTVDQDYLFHCLTVAAEGKDVLPAGYTVKDVILSWVELQGIPVITVTRKTNGYVLISQDRFYIRQTEYVNDNTHKWAVPVTYATAKNIHTQTTTTTWLTAEQPSVEFDAGITNTDWILFNLQSTAYCRVNYDVQGWNALINLLTKGDFNVISEYNRFSLIHDCHNLARAGLVDFQTTFKLIRYLKRDTSYGAWTAGFYFLESYKSLLLKTEGYEAFKTFALDLIQERVEYFGSITEVPDTFYMSRFKNRIIYLAVTFGLESYCQESLQLVRRWISEGVDSKVVPTEFWNSVCQGAVQYGGAEEFYFVYELAQKAAYDDSTFQFALALAWTQDEVLLKKFLEFVIDPKEKISRFASSLFKEALDASTKSFEVCLRFVEENALRIQKNTFNNLRAYLVAILERSTTVEHINRIKVIIATYVELGITLEDSEMKRGFAEAEYSITFLAKYEVKITSSLTSCGCSDQKIFISQ